MVKTTLRGLALLRTYWPPESLHQNAQHIPGVSPSCALSGWTQMWRNPRAHRFDHSPTARHRSKPHSRMAAKHDPESKLLELTRNAGKASAFRLSWRTWFNGSFIADRRGSFRSSRTSSNRHLSRRARRSACEVSFGSTLSSP